jgi:hypothetical protein
MFGAPSLLASVTSDNEIEMDNNRNESKDTDHASSLLSEKVGSFLRKRERSGEQNLSNSSHGFRYLQSSKVPGATVLVKCRLIYKLTVS